MYDYNNYIKQYNAKNIVHVSMKLHREHDEDIIKLIGETNKQGTLKRIIRENEKLRQKYKISKEEEKDIKDFIKDIKYYADMIDNLGFTRLEKKQVERDINIAKVLKRFLGVD